MLETRVLRYLLAVSLWWLFASSAGAQSTSGTELALGVQAYEHARYEEAIQHFEKAIAQDPSDVHAHLYLATACAQQYIPGVEDEDNVKFAERAIEQYKQVIDLHPTGTNPLENNLLNAVKGIAYLDLQMKRFDEAKGYYRRATELGPDDPEPYYSIGVIDWTLTYQLRQEERAKLNLKPGASLPAKDRKVCAELREKNWANIADGIENLNKALQLRPDYDDAMAYMNLMYRERADVQCEEPVAREADLKTAADWVDKTLACKKAKAEKKEGPSSPEQ